MIEDRSSKLVLCAVILATMTAMLVPSEGFAAAAGGRGAPAAGAASSGAAASTSGASTGGAGPNGGGGAVEVEGASATVGPLPVFQPPSRHPRAQIVPVVETLSDPRCMPQRFVDPDGNVFLRRMCRQPQVW